jgi:CheY-like chemotaxis protein
MKPRSVESGEAALAQMRDATAAGHPYPLVLMDWKMPGMDGIATTKAIRSESPIAGTPVVIMVTAFGREQALGAAEQSDLIDGVLLKPVTQSLLVETLCRLHSGRMAGERAPAAPRRANLLGVRLLLVEDNPINEQLARELLEQEGAEIRTAVNGQLALDALDELGADYFDAALIDLQMPEMDGFEVARHIRKMPEASHLPLIAMTAHAMREDRERCIAAGMQDHIAKPIDPELLTSRLIHWIGPESLHNAARRWTSGTWEAEAKRRHSAAQDASAELPSSLPGIDLVDGLRRCGGDSRLYSDLLGQFRQIYASAAEDVDKMCATGKIDAAYRLVHTVKGAAANLGMRDLAAAANALELALEPDDR